MWLLLLFVKSAMLFILIFFLDTLFRFVLENVCYSMLFHEFEKKPFLFRTCVSTILQPAEISTKGNCSASSQPKSKSQSLCSYFSDREREALSAKHMQTKNDLKRI